MFNHLVLAASHGGGDPGAVHGTETEASDAIAIVNSCAAHLVAHSNLRVSIVPHELNLGAEVKWVNQVSRDSASLALEVHKNSSASEGAKGVESYYIAGNTTRARQANELNAIIADKADLPNRGARPDTSLRFGDKGLWWCRGIYIPSILLEMGFIQQPANEVDLGIDLAKAIISFTKTTYQPNSTIESSAPPLKEKPPVTIYPIVTLGSNGNYVKHLQARLQAHKSDPGPVDGDFGPRTLRAVRAFQSARRREGKSVNGASVVVDGIVGVVTWTLLNQEPG